MLSVISTHCYIEDGFKRYELPKSERQIQFVKSMYEGSVIMFKIHCESIKQDGIDKQFDLELTLISQRCERHEEFTELPTLYIGGIECTKEIILKKQDLNKVHAVDVEQFTKKAQKSAHNKTKAISKSDSSVTGVSRDDKSNRNIREAQDQEHCDASVADSAKTSFLFQDKKQSDETSTTPALTTVPKTISNKTRQMSKGKTGENRLPPIKYKATYILKLNFKDKHDDLHFDVYIESKHHGSFLSAMNWPLLPFYGAMSLLYLAYAIGWFIASCCNWRDLLRLQFWIGGVIALGADNNAILYIPGMFENALFYTEFQSISHHGKENGLLYFAEIVSCIKKALARILVVIVSMGFGIVKPRLGQTLHKVLAVGGLYFLLASIEGCIKIKDEAKVIINSKTHTYALVPLILLDVVLCWWIFTSLVQTTRTLRIRKNVVKLTLYRHFTNTLIFAVLASLGYMIWMIKEAKFSDCIDMTGLWLNEAIWPFLFAVILAVIMVLWRPSQNSQRYAFTPLDLGDSDDDGNDDMTLSEAFDGMKMRTKSESHPNGNATKNRMKAEDDLKWVEENIPSVPSTLLPTLDSDEEIVMTKFETSKMD